ncbi:MAG: antitoxin AF2212-like protein [Candidatus Anammoxibacter sp.]
MHIKTKYKDGSFIPLESVKNIKEGEEIEIEISPKKEFSWKGALKFRKESSVELQHKIKNIW